MFQTAYITFTGSLTDFLKKQQKQPPIRYEFTGKPSVKDAFEALGVPHVEVAYISMNDKVVDFSFWLMDGMEITVSDRAPAGKVSLIPPAPPKPAFVLDVHLGKLARQLRLLGFDALYQTDFNDTEIVTKAVTENRIVLTRDVNLLKHGSLQHGYWLRSQHPEEQLREVVKRYNLLPQLKPFTRCMVCNHEIKPVPKVKVLNQLPPLTKQHFVEFYQCSHCGKVYWKGSHYENMQQFLSEFSKKL